MSMLGVSSVAPIPYSPWIEPVLLAVVALNVLSPALGWDGSHTCR